MKKYMLFCFFLWGFLATYACTSFAHGLQVHQAEVKGDIATYVQSKLPSPFVVYAFASSGSLVGVIQLHMKYDAAAMRKAANAIATRDFHNFESANLSSTSDALKQYLSDQGYQIKDLVNKRTPYTLLLTIWNAGNKSCAWVVESQRRYEQAIRHAVEQPSAHGGYTVDVLELSSPTVKVKCKKQT